jgi:hypothetical protein
VIQVIDRHTITRLRLHNLIMGTFHAAQGILIVLLANDFSLPVTGSFLEGPPGSGPPKIVQLFSVRIGWAVASFVFLSAFAHYLVVSPWLFRWYVDNLARGRNYARWIEYSVSSSIMIVLIAMLPGITDAAALTNIFAANAAMILFGLLMEHYEKPGRPSWLAYEFGVLIGLAPWVAIGIYFWSPTMSASPPGFVYGIFFSIFVFFNSFAANMVLQYKRIGPWRDYLFGERAYMVLSLTSKSALAWQVFSGTLVA